MRYVLSISLVILLVPALASGQGLCRDDSQTFRQVNVVPLPSGDAHEMEIVGNLAYLAAGRAGLQVWDVSIPVSPVMLGSVLGGGFYSRKLEISGDYAFVADQGMGLVVYDISDPHHPSFVAQKFVSSGPQDLVLSGDHVYFVDLNHGLWVFDVSDPRAPRIVANYRTPGEAKGIEIKGDAVFIADGTAGLTTIDISDPLAPVLLSRAGWVGEADSMELIGDLVLTGGAWSGLAMVDVSEPGAPRLLGTVEIPGECKSAEWVNGKLLLVCTKGMVALDMTVPTTPEVLYRYAMNSGLSGYGYIAESTRTDGYILLSDWDFGLRIYEDGRGFGQNFEKSVTVPARINDLGMAPGFCYVVSTDQILRTYDISDVHHPVFVSTLQVGITTQMAVQGNELFLAHSNSGFSVIDVSDPTAPMELARESSVICERIAVDDGLALVLGYYNRVTIFDISEPAHPVSLGHVSLPGYVSKVALEGRLGFLGFEGGLTIIDLANPSSPVELGVLPDITDITDMIFSGGFLLVTTASAVYDGHLVFVDYADPDDPVVSYSSALGGIGEMASDGHFLYASKGSAGGSIIDISDPGFSMEVHGMDGDADILKVGCSGDHFCMSSWNKVFFSTRICGPVETPAFDDRPVVEEAFHGRSSTDPSLTLFPNPFNARSVIRLRLDRGGQVQVGIFNLQGRMVQLLADDWMAPGDHRFIWAGQDGSGRRMASGVYFCRASASGMSLSERLLLLK